MNIFNKVTLESLKKNKVRTIVTIIGIILSAAMICAVTTSAQSFRNFVINNAIYNDGDWHASAEYCDWATYEKIKNSEKVESLVADQIIGYAKLEGCINKYKPYLFVIGAGEGYEAVMPIHLIAGNYPTSQNEIIISEAVAQNGGVIFELGQTITLELGDRMLEGWQMTQHNPNYYYDENGEEKLNDEKLSVREKRTYTVVGIYERPNFENYTAPGYTAITLADETGRENYACNVFFKMEKPKEVYSFVQENQISGTFNTDILLYLGVSEYDSFGKTLTGLSAIVIILIMFGSISLIYNAFSISVSERTKQFGLLSSIGATKKQLAQMVLFEALAVSAVGIPLGVLSGIGGIGITLLAVGDKFSSVLDTPVKMELSVSFGSIVIAAVVALVTVLISAWIPSIRATKVTAVEAIRQNTEVSVDNKPLRTPKFVYKIFGLSGVLASKYFSRSKKKYRSTIASLFMSIVLFISAFSFTGYLTESVSDGFYTDGFDIRVLVGEDIPVDKKELLSQLKNAQAVTAAAYTRRSYQGALVNTSEVTKNYLEKSEASAAQREVFEEGKTAVAANIFFVDDASFRAFLEENKLEAEKYINPDAPLGIAMDKTSAFDSNGGRYLSFDIMKRESFEMTVKKAKEIEGYFAAETVKDESGSEFMRYRSIENSEEFIDVPLNEAWEYYPMNIGATIDELPYFSARIGNTVTVFYHESMVDIVFPEVEEDYYYYLTSSDHRASANAVKTVLALNGISSNYIYNNAENSENNRNLVTIIKVFAYGFIVLISLISVANVFNTITTNINLRRREFAMLKSVGMTAKGFNLMMNYECLLYGAKALLYGLPVSAAVTYLIYYTIGISYATQFSLPWGAIGIAIFSVFAVVFATMMYAMNKIKKDNPIDALKNENL